VLHETGLDAKLEKVDLKAKKTETGADFTKVNPNGYVPALQLDDGSLLTEAAVILQYLADRTPAAKLLPPNGTMERYRVLEMLNFTATELHKAFGPLFDPSLPEPARAALVNRVGKRFDVLEGRLEGKAWICGEAFTIADAYLATIVNWSGFVKIDLSRWPKLKDYRKRVLDRPAAKAALKAEGLSK
jgi:glutathione S-transferase